MANNLKYSSKVLTRAVAKSTTWAQVCEKLGSFPDPGVMAYFKNRAIREKITFDHFPHKQYGQKKRRAVAKAK